MTQNVSLNNTGKTAGILGLGSIGLRHARLLLEAGISVQGYDPSPDGCSALVELGGYSVDRNAVLADSDFIVIASPNDQHLTDIKAAIDHGSPVLVEKPFAHDAERARQLINDAESKNILVAAAFNLRFRHIVKSVKSWLQEDIIGQVISARFVCASYLPDWRPDQDHTKGYADDPRTGGVIFDIIHEFDLAVHLMGGATVTGCTCVNTGTLGLQSEDCAEIVMRHKSGIISSIHLDYVRRPAKRSLELVGSAGVIEANLRTGHGTAIDIKGNVLRQENQDMIRDDEYRDQIAHFVHTLSSEGSLVSPGIQALDSLDLVCQARSMAGLPT